MTIRDGHTARVIRRARLRTVAALLVVLGVAGCGPAPEAPVDPESLRKVAAALQQQELYAQAVAQYERYLDTPGLDDARRASVHYLIGNIHRENLKDYESALAHYTWIATLYGASPVAADAQRHAVECLEHLNRSLDARRQLSRMTALDPAQAAPDGSEVVARIGEREFTLRQLEQRIEELPDYYQQSLEAPDQKREFLRQILGAELLADAARRKGLDRAADTRRRIEGMETQILAEAMLQTEVRDAVTVTDADAQLYYDAHKDRFTTPERVDVAHILVATEPEAQALLARLETGESFEALARVVSQDEATRDQGGALGVVMRDRPVPGLGHAVAFVEAAFAAAPGRVAGPVESTRGWHLIQVRNRLPGESRPFDEVKEQAARMLRRDREAAAEKALLQRLMEGERVVIFQEKLGAGGGTAP